MGGKEKYLQAFVKRHDSIVNFLEKCAIALNTLELMTEWSDHSASSKASQCLSAVLSPKFIMSLCVCARFNTIFANTKGFAKTTNRYNAVCE